MSRLIRIREQMSRGKRRNKKKNLNDMIEVAVFAEGAERVIVRGGGDAGAHSFLARLKSLYKAASRLDTLILILV